MTTYTKGKSAVTTPTCAFCAGIGKPYAPHWQFSKPVAGVLTCPVLLAYTCRLCNGKGHIEKRCEKRSANQPRKLFCRFCCNAKKPDYQSHNQFDKDGFVQCPVLLTIECQLCGEKGHTKGYCQSLKVPVPVPAPAPVPVSAPAPTKVSKNQFAALAVIEEEEDVPVQKSQANSWAGRLVKQEQAPAAVKQAQAPAVAVKQVQAQASAVKQAPAPAPAPAAVKQEEEEPAYVPKMSTSWADMD
jgi:hypothetical protein